MRNITFYLYIYLFIFSVIYQFREITPWLGLKFQIVSKKLNLN